MTKKRKKQDPRIRAYQTKNGEERYLFQVYAGIDPLTKKERRTTRRGFKSIQAAGLALRRLELEIAETGFKPIQTETFKDIYQLWCVNYQKKVQESTYNKTLELFNNHILPAFGHLKLKDITPLMCQDVLNDWGTRLKKSKTIMSYAGLVFTYGMKLELITRNPAKLVDNPVAKVLTTDRKQLNYYDKDQLELFFSVLQEYYHKNKMIYPLFRLLAFTGIRRGELLALTWGDLNVRNQSLLVNKALTTGLKGRLIVQPPKTINSIREVTLDPVTLSILTKWQKEQKELYFKLGYNTTSPEQLIFANTANQHLSLTKPQSWLNTLITNYDLPKITLHGFRHTHCSLLFEANATFKDVQARLGHSDIRTTMNIYAHVTPQRQSETAQLFADYVDF